MCKLGSLLARDLTLPDRALLVQWLKDGTDSRGQRVSAEVLSVALQAKGRQIGPTTLKDHRGGRCACYRKGTSHAPATR